MSIVRNAGHKVFFIDNYLRPTDFIESGFMKQKDIDIVAIHANTICFRDTLRMAHSLEKLRERGEWRGKIIVGGPHASVAPETIPEFVDHVVQGEGEKVILDVITGEERERVVRKESLKELDHLPFQPWDIFNGLPYDYTCPWMDVQPVFTMNTSRGCPFDCNFCSVCSIWGRRYTSFSALRIVEEIEYLVREYGARGIYFREDNFTLDGKRVSDFCSKLRKKNIDISWACETRVDTLTDEGLVEEMSRSGCGAVYLGVESGSQRILDMLNKKITIEQIEKAVCLATKYNIRAYCSLITGVPGETYEDFLLTKKLIDDLKPYSYSFGVFVGIPNSPLYRHILENNLYEHKDDIGLLYLPGYDVRAEYFYGRDSKNFVDYDFKERTDFDKKLLIELQKKKMMQKIDDMAASRLLSLFARGIKKIARLAF
ncbi:MAG: radical SAM protein [Deltaproteobacteria bacterium]|nr:radical SAM protein [Deltaproteobacteria bacterium]